MHAHPVHTPRKATRLEVSSDEPIGLTIDPPDPAVLEEHGIRASQVGTRLTDQFPSAEFVLEADQTLYAVTDTDTEEAPDVTVNDDLPPRGEGG